MSLTEWSRNKWLRPHTTSVREIDELLRKVDRDIAEATKEEITLDWRLVIAYNACLGCATIALRASGYRIPGRAGQHYRTIQSLIFTINPDPELIISLEAFGKKRAVVSYDAAGTVSEAEVNEAIDLARELRGLLLTWLKNEHPELVGGSKAR